MHRAHQAQAVKIYRAEITSRPTRGSEIFGERRFGFPGLEAPLALFPLHVLIGSALSTIGGYTHVRAQKSLKFFFFVSGRDGRGPVCVLDHFFRISLAQLLPLHQAAFFPPAQLLENLRKN